MRIVIGEDEALLRQGLTHVLEHAGYEVVATAADADELLRHTVERAPDLVITDIRMPPTHTDEGLVAALHIHRTLPSTAIVVLSQHVRRGYAVELLTERPTGVGYLLKQRIADIPTFCADLERICAGATVLDPEVVGLMLARARRESWRGRRPHGPSDGGPRTRRARAHERRGRPTAVDHREVGRAARVPRLRPARSAAERRRSPPRPRGAALSRALTSSTSATRDDLSSLAFRTLHRIMVGCSRATVAPPLRRRRGAPGDRAAWRRWPSSPRRSSWRADAHPSLRPPPSRLPHPARRCPTCCPAGSTRTPASPRSRRPH